MRPHATIPGRLRALVAGAAALATLGALGAAPASAQEPASAQAIGSSLTFHCVGGAIGCQQVDFFLDLLPASETAWLDFLRITIAPSSIWRFADPNIGEAEDAGGLNFVDPVVGPMGRELVAHFPFGAELGPRLRLRAEFARWDDGGAGLDFTYAGGSAASPTLVSGSAAATVPEPATLLLVASGLAGVARIARRARRQS